MFQRKGGSPPTLWFTSGNHEDFEALTMRENSGDRRSPSFAVDAYGFVRCIRDGQVESLPGSLRVGAVWGIDDRAPNARRKPPERGRIRERSLTGLAGSSFDVLLSHNGPRDAVLADSGSEGLSTLISLARPTFAFFGHYGSRFGEVEVTTGGTRVYHLAGFEMRKYGSCAEAGSVGFLTWGDNCGVFDYLDESWLRGFTRQNRRQVTA